MNFEILLISAPRFAQPNTLSSSSSGRRYFGTILSGNSPASRGNIQKDVSSVSKQAKNTRKNQYTVSFGRGPIGIELERGILLQSGMPCCRVQRFADGGPSNPGPARASGCIRPGDVVVAVNGSPVTTYDETIAILKDKSIKREMTFQTARSEYHNVPNTTSKRLPGTLRKKIIRSSSFDIEETTASNTTMEQISTSLRKSKSEQSIQRLYDQPAGGSDFNDIMSPRTLLPKAEPFAATPLMNEASNEENPQQKFEPAYDQYSPLLMSPSFTSIALASTKKPFRNAPSRRIDGKQSKDLLHHLTEDASSLSQATEDGNKAEGSIHNLSSESATTSKSHEMSLDSTFKSTSQFLKLQQDYAALEEKNRVLQQEKDSHFEETKRLRDELRKSAENREVLEHDLKESLSKIERFESDIEDEASVKDAIRGKLEFATRQMEKEQEKHEKEMQEEQRRFSEVSLLLITTQQKMQAAEEHASKDIASLITQLEVAQEINRKTTSELEKVEERANEAEKELQTATGRVESLTQKLENGKDLYLEKCKRLEETMQNLERFQSQQDSQSQEALDQETKVHRETRDALEDARADLMALEQAFESKNLDMDKLSTKLMQKESELENIQRSHQQEKDSFLRKLSEESAKSRTLQEIVQKSASTIDSLGTENKSVREELSLLSDQFASETAALKSKVQTLEHDLLQSADCYDKLIHDHQLETEKLRLIIQQTDENVDSLRTENDTLVKEKLSLEEIVQGFEINNERLQNQLADALHSQANNSVGASAEDVQQLIHQIEVLEDERDQAKLEKEEIMRALVEKTEDSVFQTKEMSNALRDAHVQSKEVEDSLIQRSVELQAELLEKEQQLQASHEELEALRENLRSREETLSGIQAHEASIAGIDASFAAESQLLDMRTEMKVLERKHRSLEATCGLLKRQNSDLINVKEELHKSIQDLKDQVEQKDILLMKESAEVESLQAKLEEAEEKTIQGQEHLHRMSVLCDMANRKNDEMKKSQREFVERAKHEEEKFMRELIATQDELSKIDQVKTDSEKILRTMRRSLAESESRATATREKLTTERALTRTYIKKSEEERQKLSARIEELELEVGRVEKVSSTVTAEKNALHAEATTLASRIDELKNESHAKQTELQTELSKLSTERERLTIQIKQERDKYLETEEKLRDRQVAVETISKELQGLKSHYEKELNLFQFNSELRQKQYESDFEEKERIEEALLQKETELNATQKDLYKTQQELIKARAEIDDLQERLLEAAQKATSDAVEMRGKHANELSLLAAKNQSLSLELLSSTASAEETSRTLEDKERELEAVISNFQALADENRALTDKLHANEANLSLLEETVNQLREEYVDASHDETASFFGLPRAELRALAQELRDDLTRVEDDLKQCRSELEARKKRIDNLYEERENTSSELCQILEMNKKLESSLRKKEHEKAEATEEISSLKTTLESLSAQKDRIEQDLSTQISMSDALSSRLETALHDSESTSKQYESTVQELTKEIETLRNRLKEVQSENTEFEKEAFSKKEEIIAQSKLIEEQSKMMKVQESNHEAIQSQLNSKIKQLDETLSRKELSCSKIEEELNKVHEEFIESRKVIAESKINIQTMNQKLQQAQSREKYLVDQKNELEKSLNHHEKHREEAVDKLSEATALVVQQKKTILEQEKSLKESNSTRATLLSQVTNLQHSLEKLEEKSDRAGEASLAHSQAIQQQISDLQREVDIRNEECSKLTDEALTQKRLLQDSERRNNALKKRCDQLKTALATSKESENSLVEEKEVVTAQLKDLQYVVESKQRDIDHLTSKTHVLMAQNARIKSNRLLEEEEATTESETSLEVESELRALKSQLETQNLKIQALLQSHREQHRELSHSQSQTTQLLRYTEDFIAFVTDTLCELQNTLHDQQDGGRSLWKSMHYLDLAAKEGNAPEIDEFLSEFSNRLVQAGDDLDTWKQKRSRGDSTPVKESSTNLDILNASLDTMKQMLDEEFLSPHKQRNSNNASSFDAEYLQEVIHSLDSQIDGLLADLRTANESLKAKDKLFADLEGLLSSTESQKEKLEMKLNKIMSSRKDSCDAEASESDEESLCIEQASHMLGRFFEDQDHRKKSAAFRRWSHEASSQAAKEQRMDTAKRITNELESAQEKITILQNHVSRVQSPRSSPEYGLKRIEEALVRSLASSPSEHKQQDS